MKRYEAQRTEKLILQVEGMSWQASQTGGNTECMIPWWAGSEKGGEKLFQKGQEEDADISGRDSKQGAKGAQPGRKGKLC